VITKTEELPVLGFMLGDYTGIGPEQCARVLADGRLRDAARLLVVGDSRVLAQGSRDVALCPQRVAKKHAWRAGQRFASGRHSPN